MASSLSRCRTTTAQISKELRFMSTSTTSGTKASHHNYHKENHKFQNPSSFIGSWKAPKDPKEAEARLAQLRRDYAKQVKQMRKLYMEEVELMRLEKLRRDEARREALRLQNEERKKIKAEAAKARAEERQVAELEFRQSLLKERAEKLEYWKMREKNIEEKKKEKNDQLRRQSSIWVEETELEKRILEAIVDTTAL